LHGSKYTGLVIGGGNIGAKLGVPGAPFPQCHAGAITACPETELLAICEPFPKEDIRKWGVPVIETLDLALSRFQPDFAVVAVPDEEQFQVLSALEKRNVRLVVAEKPLAQTVEEARYIVDLYRSSGKELIVNLSRRYSKMYLTLSEAFSNGSERPISTTIHYAKGLRHNGVHALDLVCMLFGDVLECVPLYSRADYKSSDPSVAVYLKTQFCPQVFLSVLDDSLYTHFEVDIFTNKRRYVIDQDHRRLTVSELVRGIGTPPGSRLSTSDCKQTDYDGALSALVSNVVGILNGGIEPMCSGEQALASMEMACDILGKVRYAGD
tara:strand:+ start:163567 stop:164535 length:969 start_codon:yes stop_codon:yes gene_type:complete